MTESNKDRDLVEKLLKQQQQHGIQNLDVIINVTTYADKFNISEDTRWDISFFMNRQLLHCLVENASKWTNEEMNEIGIALGPKLDDFFFPWVFHEYFSKNFMKTKTVYNLFKLVDKMGLAAKIELFNFCSIADENCWLPLMAFSTAVTVDALVKEVPNYMEILNANGDEEQINGTHKFWSIVKKSKTIAGLREKSSLKYLCRTKLREILVKAHGTKIRHSQLVTNVKLLDLPNKVQQFVLYNYTDYDF